MPIYRLTEDIVFPPPELAEEDGMLAVGGDLSVERLLCAYTMGIFPWYMDDSPILWWAPNPRLILIPSELKVSRSLRQEIKKNTFSITMDEDFKGVITACSNTRRDNKEGTQKSTWITTEMIDAYIRLYEIGVAHSVESWYNGELVGGLYGISMGKAFFGESMFTKHTNASKVAFVHLVNHLIKWDFILIDCQVKTNHLMSFGAREIPIGIFLRLLDKALDYHTKTGKWTFNSDFD